MIEKKNIQLVKNKLISNSLPEPTSGCWLWTGATKAGSHKYGRMQVDNKSFFTHRLAYFVFKSKIKDNLFVCHACDIPQCINPDHLFLGTQEDNMTDAKKKGRMKKPKLLFCLKGHPLIEENVDIFSRKGSTVTSGRRCHKCRVDWMREKRTKI